MSVCEGLKMQRFTSKSDLFSDNMSEADFTPAVDSEPTVELAHSEPSREVKKFAFNIGQFRLMTKNWFNFESAALSIYPGCCRLWFKIERELAQKQIDEEPDSWIFKITTIGDKVDKHYQEAHQVRFINCNRHINSDDGSRIFAESGSTLYGHVFTLQVNAEQLKESSNLLNSDVLEFRLELELFKLTEHSRTTSESPEPPGDLAVNLGNLFETQHLSDFIIQTADEPLTAHKVLLAARSPVFRAMLSVDMEENKNNLMHLEEVDAETMRIFLRYIYTDSLEFKEGDGTDLKLTVLQLADRYQIWRLKTLCEMDLSKNLTADSIIKILKVADSYGAKKLRENAIAFVKLHRSSLAKNEEMASLVSHSKELSLDVFEAVTI